jgi:hypothetical protein
MRRTLTAIAVAGGLVLTGCGADAEQPDPLDDRTGPATLAPDDLGEDAVDLDEIQRRIDELRDNLQDGVGVDQEEGAAALDDAEAALEEARQARGDGDQGTRDEVAQQVDAAATRVHQLVEVPEDAFGRTLDDLWLDLQRLAEELRRAPG